MTATDVYDNTVRIGYARVSTRVQDHQAQLDALAGAQCREVIVETASTRGERPKLMAALDLLQAGDTLVIYKPDRIARSMKELLVLLEDQLHARGINLHILTGICAGTHRPSATELTDVVDNVLLIDTTALIHLSDNIEINLITGTPDPKQTDD